VILPASPRAVYDAFVDPRRHAAFTDSPAAGSRRVGARFSACGGYISAVHRELVPGRRIVQDWSTTEWPEGAPVSRLELTLKPVPRGTELRMVHSNVPASQADAYRQGWIDYYWAPLKAYFEKRVKRPRRSAAARASAGRRPRR